MNYASHKIKSLSLIVISGLLLIQFQNCAKPKQIQFEDQKATQTMSFFEYRYMSATPIYFEVQIALDSQTSSAKTYSILGFATNSDNSADPIEYKLEMFNSTDQSICSQKTGILTAGETLTNESCVIGINAIVGKVVMQVRHQGGQWYVYEKSYIN